MCEDYIQNLLHYFGGQFSFNLLFVSSNRLLIESNSLQLSQLTAFLFEQFLQRQQSSNNKIINSISAQKR